MRVMVTGANGFIGRVLVERLLALGQLRGTSIEALLLFDQELVGFGDDRRLRRHIASITETAVLRRALADGVDVVFHLAGIPGAAAEREYERGYQTNLLGSLELLQQLRALTSPPVLVHAGSSLWQSSKCGSQTAHAQMVDIALSDLARRGEVDGRVLRLPTLVAQTGHCHDEPSAFMGELLQTYAAGRPYCCPVAADTPLAWMSVHCGVDNLLHAAEIKDVGAHRIFQVPALRRSPVQLLRALSARFGGASRTLISFAPDLALEGLCGRISRAASGQAQAVGFRHDGSAAGLVRNVFDAMPSSSMERRSAEDKITSID